MDLSYGEEYEAFAEEVTAFLKANWKHGADAPPPAVAQIAEFRLKAIAAGYLARSIPKQYGGSGQGLDLIKNAVISEEFRSAGAPEDPADLGYALLVPTLLEVGDHVDLQVRIGEHDAGHVATFGDDTAQVTRRLLLSHQSTAYSRYVGVGTDDA